MGKEPKERPTQQGTPKNVEEGMADLEGLLQVFTNLDTNKAYSSITPELENEVEKLKKSVDLFAKMTDDLCKAIGLTNDEKEKLLKDPSKCRSKEVQTIIQKGNDLKKAAKTIVSKSEAGIKARGGQVSEHDEGLTQAEKDKKLAEDGAKKRKTLRGKKNWMPL